MNDSELEAYLREFDECAIAPTRRLIAAYVKGQLGPLPRKSVMPIARAAGIAPRTLQELLSLHRWDEELMRTRVQHRIRRLLGAAGATAVLQATVVPKRGTKTPGVDRLENRATGRVANCCVLVHLSLTTAAQWALFDGDLYLPRTWVDSPERLRQAGIPAGTRYRSEAALGLDLLDRAVRGGLRPRWVLFDPAYALDAGFLAGLESRGLRYVTEVPGGFRGCLDARRANEPEARTILEQVQPRTLRRLVSLPSGEGRPELGSCPMEVFPFDPAPGFGSGGPHALVVLRHPWSGQFRLYLTNGRPEEDVESLLATALSYEPATRAVERGLEGIGFSHFEVRTFRSLQRHVRLSEASLLFLSEQRARPARTPLAAAP